MPVISDLCSNNDWVPVNLTAYYLVYIYLDVDYTYYSKVLLIQIKHWDSITLLNVCIDSNMNYLYSVKKCMSERQWRLLYRRSDLDSISNWVQWKSSKIIYLLRLPSNIRDSYPFKNNNPRSIKVVASG